MNSPFFASTTPISAHEIALIETSFRKLSRNSAQAAALFYTRLFDFDPLFRALLKNDRSTAHRKFFHHLGTIVHRLDCYDVVRDYVSDLIAGHPCFANTDEHIRTIGAALFWMLEQMLGDDFTPDVYAAWMTVFVTLSNDLKTATTREFAMAG
jgi:hemoglobin-like flavoprotein